MFFDKVKVPLVERLVKTEEEEVKRSPGSDYFAPVSRPRPEFSEVKQETLSGTIPWETPAKTKVNEGRGSATTSQHCEVLANVLVQPHHHHHLVLPPAPHSCTAQLAATSCLAPSADAAPSGHQLPVWHDNQDCRYPPVSIFASHCDGVTQATSSYRMPE